ncbi:hypothetical protein [Streptomyces sporangiiformans]|uniref:DUF916 domain-containing protein n=1 Tax=Streptomyces sporangiiformans TaxID=2315329 RepID=A0A505D7E6_9ACTN|nr:hypothetical protein [Streptomyces sporangiiformans]TPQ19614.1 hypothetical protein FGD71_024980 [Streptomyces sporangiiformans]
MPSAARVLRLAATATVTAAAAAAVVVLGVAPTAVADDRWSVVPSTGGEGRPAQEGRPYFYAEGLPGSVLQDTVSVINPGGKPLTVRLRGADADNSGKGGGFALRARATDTGAWITFAERTVQVPARTRADVPFTVSVPEGATPGDHPGAIVASGGDRSAAVRVQLRVGGPTLSALTVEHVALRDGRISYDLVNRGTTVLEPKLAVRADGLFGEVLDRAPRTLPLELLPGRRVTLSEPWPDRPALDSVDVRLTVSAAGGAHDEAGTSARFVPWRAVAGAAAGGLALCAGGAYGLVRRRRRAGEKPGEPGERCESGESGGSGRTEVELTGAVT